MPGLLTAFFKKSLNVSAIFALFQRSSPFSTNDIFSLKNGLMVLQSSLLSFFPFFFVKFTTEIPLFLICLQTDACLML